MHFKITLFLMLQNCTFYITELSQALYILFAEILHLSYKKKNGAIEVSSRCISKSYFDLCQYS